MNRRVLVVVAVVVAMLVALVMPSMPLPIAGGDITLMPSQAFFGFCCSLLGFPQPTLLTGGGGCGGAGSCPT